MRAEGRSLDTIETNVPRNGLPPVFWGSVRKLAIDISRNLDAIGFEKKAKSLRWCNSDYQVYVNREGEYKISGLKCRDRLCPSCQIIRSRKLVHKYQGLAKSMKYPVLITLTLKADSGLKNLIKKMRKCFKYLRKKEIWKNHVEGYVSAIETKRSVKESCWFVHNHILADVPVFLHQRSLSSVWEQVTGDSYIVDIRKADRRGLYEVLKYITKVTDFIDDTDLLAEFIDSVSGARMISTGGNLRGRLKDADLDREEHNWVHLGGLKEYMDRWNKGTASLKDIAVIVFAVQNRFIDWGVLPVVQDTGET